MRHGEGTFVAAHLPLHRLGGQQDKFVEELAQLVRQGRMLGFSRHQLRQIVDDAIKPPTTERAKAGARR
jgi:hypothetical protein